VQVPVKEQHIPFDPRVNAENASHIPLLESDIVTLWSRSKSVRAMRRRATAAALPFARDSESTST
jgi:hypothetical protein